MTSNNSYKLNELTESLINSNIIYFGWIRRVRMGASGTMAFIDIYDGTITGELKCVAEKENYKPIIKSKILEFDKLLDSSYLSPGSSVCVKGILVKSPDGTTQNFELKTSQLEVIGEIEDCQTYPIQKSCERNLMALRKLPFMRMRSQLTQSLFRIRSSLLFVIHKFFHENNVVCTDPNILTSSDCEGAGEMFKITPQMFGENPVGLTVSSQLPLEALATGFRDVYTCQKSFRAEKSDTSKHLSEFLHIEYEGYFKTLDTLLEFTEKFIKTCIRETMDIRKAEFNFLKTKQVPLELHRTSDLVNKILDKDFVKLKHRDAVDLIRKLVKDKTQLPDESGKLKKVKVKVWPEYDGDLASDHEKILVTYFDSFVAVTHWPLGIKSFYMKQVDDESGECESFDLLAPSVGELFGGSMREWRYDKLDNEIKKRGMDVSSLQWYLDLRKLGSAPHGGWGLGFDRLLMLITGVSSVRDIVPFPVYWKYCPH